LEYYPLQIINIFYNKTETGYREYLPSPSAARYVMCYWFFRRHGISGNILVNPDACADIIFDLGGSSSENFCRITGTFFERFDIDGSGMNTCGIRLRPGIMHYLIRDSAEILTGTTAAPDDFNLRFTDQIAEKISGKTDSEITSFFDSFIPEHFDKIITADHRFASANNIFNAFCEGKESEILFSGKTADRYFKRYFGMSRKKISSIIRFQNSLKMLAKGHPSVPDGYFDQAHFIKDFKTFSGMTPGEFKKNSLWAVTKTHFSLFGEPCRTIKTPP
jgi:AraC-like DNA-binding protein